MTLANELVTILEDGWRGRRYGWSDGRSDGGVRLDI